MSSPEWHEAAFADLFPSYFTDLATSINSVVTPVAGILNVVTVGLEAAKVFLIGIPFDFLGAVEAAINAARDALLAPGVKVVNLLGYPTYEYYLAKTSIPEGSPGWLSAGVGFGGRPFTDFTDTLASSFEDLGDDNRPQTTGPTICVVLVMGTDSFGDLVEPILNFHDLFLSDWEYILSIVNEIRGIYADFEVVFADQDIDPTFSDEMNLERRIRKRKAYEEYIRLRKAFRAYFGDDEGDQVIEEIRTLARTIATSQIATKKAIKSESPDWEDYGMGDILKPLRDMFDVIVPQLLAILKAGPGIIQMVVGMIEGIQAKVDALQDLVDLLAAITTFIATLGTLTGVKALVISSPSGSAAIPDLIRNADDPFEGAYGFHSGIAFVGYGATYAPIAATFGLL